VQRPDGSWLPLWFGNHHHPDEGNPTYGTARVLAAYRDVDLMRSEPARRGVGWLVANQNADGGWGGAKGIASSVEETALATEILLSVPEARDSALRGLNWLLERVEDGSYTEPTPIGFYFAKLWYFEALYPTIFMTAALRRAVETLTPAAGRKSEVSLRQP
jgi:squalene-hopene/tetraprenyl-beta-curcumene cyclase